MLRPLTLVLEHHQCFGVLGDIASRLYDTPHIRFSTSTLGTVLLHGEIKPRQWPET